MLTIDGNEAAARIAHQSNEVIAIYPITPASPMGESAEEWASIEKRNLLAAIPARPASLALIRQPAVDELDRDVV